jgi:hypothetical protein
MSVTVNLGDRGRLRSGFSSTPFLFRLGLTAIIYSSSTSTFFLHNNQDPGKTDNDAQRNATLRAKER